MKIAGFQKPIQLWEYSASVIAAEVAADRAAAVVCLE